MARGKSADAGRYKDDDPITQQLVSEAALQLSILGNNPQLAKMLGQNARPPPILMEHLEEAGLPNPMLALLSQEQMERNFECLDQQFARKEGQPARRLMMAIDCTYLSRSLVQAKHGGKPGLIGGPWCPSEPAKCFIPLDDVPPGALKGAAKASVMLECLCWSPCAKYGKTYSVAAMPMTLTPVSDHETHKGNWETMPIVCKIFFTP
eukprot:s578_g13.t2